MIDENTFERVDAVVDVVVPGLGQAHESENCPAIKPTGFRTLVVRHAGSFLAQRISDSQTEKISRSGSEFAELNVGTAAIVVENHQNGGTWPPDWRRRLKSTSLLVR
jgi:hypothetical protein